MKKLFLLILSIALLACSKEEPNNKPIEGAMTVEITIENSAAITKAVTPMAGQSSAVCSVSDLTALFADKDGKILPNSTSAFPNLVNGKYTFNDLPANVSQVAVIALRGLVEPTSLATLADARDLAATELVDANYDELVVYGEDCSPVHSMSGNSNVLTATITVAPLQARIEVASIKTTDRFTNYKPEGSDEIVVPEYSNYNLKSLSLAGYSNYDADLTGLIFGLNSEGRTVTNITPNESNTAWSWNIKEQPVKNMVLSLDLVGNGYSIAVPGRTLTINKYKVDGEEISKFKAGNIYRFDIVFSQDNFDVNSTSEVKVDVTLDIANWVINTTTVEFAN